MALQMANRGYYPPTSGVMAPLLISGRDPSESPFPLAGPIPFPILQGILIGVVWVAGCTASGGLCNFP